MMNYFGGRRDPKQTAREAIVGLREQLLMNEKKEELLLKKIEEDLKTARANATTNQQRAKHALRQKKMHEAELDRLGNQKMQLEIQINTLEGANMNAETMLAMKKGSEALKHIHKSLDIDKVGTIMADIEDQRQLANEIADVIAQPSGDLIDEDELKDELEQLQQEELDSQLLGAAHVPAHVPAGAIPAKAAPARTQDEDDEEELRKLQESLAMPS
ncbi:Snf7-domain-containing protein [Vararia minispora EC-137]|uniref:Snf7-domain-containing protein n=1 Tax=Vararia minispora EC-137 TaxID=1314806 RepID=A0ACB8Q428_9AGAM|nr:Snf7-domain-containing protein [Vararia minispora EC-137]